MNKNRHQESLLKLYIPSLKLYKVPYLHIQQLSKFEQPNRLRLNIALLVRNLDAQILQPYILIFRNIHLYQVFGLKPSIFEIRNHPQPNKCKKSIKVINVWSSLNIPAFTIILNRILSSAGFLLF